MRNHALFLAAIAALMTSPTAVAGGETEDPPTSAEDGQAKMATAASNPFEVQDPGLKEAIETARKALALARGWRAGDASLGARIEELELAQTALAEQFERGSLSESDRNKLTLVFTEVVSVKTRISKLERTSAEHEGRIIVLEETVYLDHEPRLEELEGNRWSLVMGDYIGLVARAPMPGGKMFLPSYGLRVGIGNDVPGLGWILTGGAGFDLAAGIDTDLTLATYARRRALDGTWRDNLNVGGYTGVWGSSYGVLNKLPGVTATEGGAHAGVHLEQKLGAPRKGRTNFLTIEAGGRYGMGSLPGFQNNWTMSAELRVGVLTKRTLSAVGAPVSELNPEPSPKSE